MENPCGESLWRIPVENPDCSCERTRASVGRWSTSRESIERAHSCSALWVTPAAAVELAHPLSRRCVEMGLYMGRVVSHYTAGGHRDSCGHWHPSGFHYNWTVSAPRPYSCTHPDPEPLLQL